MPPALAQIKDILAFGQSKLITKEEMSALIAALTKFIKSYKEAQIKEIQMLREMVKNAKEEMKKETANEKTLGVMRKEMIRAMAEVKADIPLPANLSGVEHRLHTLETKPEMKMPTMDEMKMHALMGLSVADIAGLEERLKQLDRMARGGGGRLLGGVLNVGMRVETPEGTVDGTNVTFTAFKEPKRVVGDGAVYYAGQGYTYSGKTITMDVAPAKFIRSEY